MSKSVWLIPALLFSLSGFTQQATTAGQPATPGGTASPASAAKSLVISSGVAQANRIGGDMPAYPAIAKAAQIQGTVVLGATISKEGLIQDLKVVSGPPMLQGAAMDAVRTWRYKPYLLNGEPVQVETQINVVFSLGTGSSAGGPQGAPPTGAPVTRTVQVTGLESPEAGPRPEHPITQEQVKELMELTGVRRQLRQMLDGMMPMMKTSMPPWMPADVLEDFENSVVGADWDQLALRSYQAHISTEDAAAAIAFYQTPAGQRLLTATPFVMKGIQASAGQLGMQLMEETLARHKTEIDAAKEKYEADHPWSPPKN